MLVIDLCYSFNVVGKVRRFAVDNEIVIKYESLKQEIRLETDDIRKKGRFLLTLKPESALVDMMKEKLEKIKL